MTTKDWAPVKGKIMTEWAQKVDPECPLPEYPRPQMKRADWINLNGIWECAIVKWGDKAPDRFDGEILVPFCLESVLSGIKKSLLPEQRLWYKREIIIPEKWQGKRVLLHFGAVDWETEVYVNGKSAGTHRGGYLPFYFDISGMLKEKNNRITVAVWDPTDSHWQQKGKQSLAPKGVFYTAVSGIWQTVWMEAVPETHIERLIITPDIDNESVEIKCLASSDETIDVKVSVTKESKDVMQSTGKSNSSIVLPIKNAEFWSPDNPHLYDVKIELMSENEVTDCVESYFGMRKFSIQKDEIGVKRLAVNNEIMFHNGLLDQGYWPDGLYTAPTEEALKFDILAAKKLGFNMIRKHIKVEPQRWYYWCDRLGIVVWQDMINGGAMGENLSYVLRMAMGSCGSKKDTTLKYNKRKMRDKKEARDDFERELKEMVDALYNTASIALWTVFNESWGQFDASRISKWLAQYDPTRTVDATSGWGDQRCGQLQSHHVYFLKLKFPKIYRDRTMVLSEYGGYKLRMEDNIWSEKTFGYSGFKTKEEFENGYIDLIEKQTIPLKSKGCAAAIYTQLTDVEIEINGFYTYDRKFLKADEAKIRNINQKLIKR